MKANVSSTIKAYLVRGALYLLLLLAVCVVPFALAQRTANKQSLAANATELATTSSDSDRDAGALPMPGFPTGGAIYNQYDNPATKPPLGIGSQKFEPAMAAFDDQAADDFVITAPPPPIFLYTTGVRVMGEYSEGGGPASSFNVYIYANGAGNLPGAGIASFLNLPYTGTPPDFVIHWSPFSLPSGTYWVSVQAVQNFNTNGQWFWHNRTVQSNSGAAWQNPGNGYGTSCLTWNRKNACMSDQVWPDQVFQILGFVEGPTPTATPTATHAPSSTPTATFPPSPTPTATLTPTSTPTVSPIPTPSDPGGTPTATPTATCCQYIPTTGTGTIEPGTTDIGNHCDNCTTTIPLPFTVRLYGQIPAQVASVSSNGNLQYVNQLPYAGASCPLPDLNLGTAILPYQDDLRTDQVADCSVFGSGCGVFTSVTGTAPNRAFNIEWRAAYSGRSGTANFEVRFYENQNSFDIFYGATADNGGSEESGVQAGVSLGCPATTFSCHTPTLTNGLKVTYSCGAPVTPTPTATATAPPPSPTTTTTITPTITPPSPSPSPTIFDTPTPTPTLARVSPTPRPRPSPTSRP